MKKNLKNNFFWFLVLYCALFESCKKQEMPYDLFPLKVGNEFYYKYYQYRFTGISAYTNGTEIWRVASASEQENSITYTIKRNLNAILKVAGNSDTISNSISYLQVIEDKSSSMISIWGFSFKRYEDVRQIELVSQGNTSTPSVSCVFKADSGMITYTYYHPPNQITNETLSLDSLKIIP
jgi:hypothetical protein